MAGFTNGHVLCAITNIPLAMEDVHVDHAPPWTFDRIFNGLRTAYPNIQPIHVGTRDVFGDRDVEFRQFHNSRACLRLVHKTANLSLLRKN
jgi:hypothetical protein